MTTAIASRPGLTALADDIRTILTDNPQQTADAVAAVLRAHRPTAELLTELERAGDPCDIMRVDLHAEDRFSIQAVVWQPGQETFIHDHIAWCAFGVLQGVEEETVYRDHGDHLTVIGREVNGVGEANGFAPPGDIHSVRNPGSTTTITLHVYGAHLSDGRSSVYRVYRTPVRPEGR